MAQVRPTASGSSLRISLCCFHTSTRKRHLQWSRISAHVEITFCSVEIYNSDKVRTVKNKQMRKTTVHAADRAFRFMQVLMQHQLLKVWDFYWTKCYARVTAGATASKYNECINKDRDDDDNTEACWDIAPLQGIMVGYKVIPVVGVCCDYVGERAKNLR